MTKRIMIASAICQKPPILREFLTALREIDSSGLAIEYLFVDNNQSAEAREVLHRFCTATPHVAVWQDSSPGDYNVDGRHRWSEKLIWKVADYKDTIITEAAKRDVDALFLLDSDLLIAPKLLQHLIELNKDIVSEVYWTRWEENGPALPQVWVSDQYELLEKRRDEQPKDNEIIQRTRRFLNRLREPGTYRVGGLGACTLISRNAIQKGVRFAEIDNISMVGEDRHFCIRARVLGLELWADTRYPPLHIYREADLERVPMHKTRTGSDFFRRPKLTLMMTVRNEADRWLPQALRAHRGLINEAVIVDDASDDDTAQVIRRELDGVRLHLHRNPTSRFSNESDLRTQLWEATIATNPDWILALDADEILEQRAQEVIPALLKQTEYSVFGFPCYDFWSATHYREDDMWCAHKGARPYLLRYTPDFAFAWRRTAQHCGSFPANIMELSCAAIDLRVKHMGWSDPKERERKAQRYRSLDPDAIFGIKEQYESILDPEPNLVPWVE